MSFRGLLRHTVAIVTPGAADITDLDEAGFPVMGEPTYRIEPAMIQPVAAHEVNAPRHEGAEITDFIIFLEMQELSAVSYITEANDDGPIPGGRRFQIIGIQPFDFGRDPHLEVNCKLVGNTEYIPGS